jgi:adenylosuccinate lyase
VELFSGDGAKAELLDQAVARALGFGSPVALSSQTTPRKLDVQLSDALAGIGITLGKLSRDVRLLAHTGEVREAFLAGQVGSSAMPYKRNPMRAERVTALARLLVHSRSVVAETASVQWLERSLDDSAVKRIALPDQFLAADGALRAAIDLSLGLEVDHQEVSRRLKKEAPFLASEALLASGVAQGGDRQELHERLRICARLVRDEGADFVQELTKDPVFSKLGDELAPLLRPERHCGRAPEQALSFVASVRERLITQQRVPPFNDPLNV